MADPPTHPLTDPSKEFLSSLQAIAGQAGTLMPIVISGPLSGSLLFSRCHFSGHSNLHISAPTTQTDWALTVCTVLSRLPLKLVLMEQNQHLQQQTEAVNFLFYFIITNSACWTAEFSGPPRAVGDQSTGGTGALR